MVNLLIYYLKLWWILKGKDQSFLVMVLSKKSKVLGTRLSLLGGCPFTALWPYRILYYLVPLRIAVLTNSVFHRIVFLFITSIGVFRFLHHHTPKRVHCWILASLHVFQLVLSGFSASIPRTLFISSVHLVCPFFTGS